MSDVILEKLAAVFTEVFDDDGLVIRRGMTASDVDGWDSLAHVRLMLTVERAFSIRFTATEIGRLKTVGDLIDLIARKKRDR